MSKFTSNSENDPNNEIKFKAAMIKSSLYDYSDPYTFMKRTISVVNTAGADADANNTNKKVIFKITIYDVHHFVS